MKHIITLDKERELRFDYTALCALEETCQINIYKAGLFDEISPSRTRDLVWAAQLSTEKPLTREQVAKYLPTKPELLMGCVEVVANALRDAFEK